MEHLLKKWKIESVSSRKPRLILFLTALFLFPLLLMKPVIQSTKPIYTQVLQGHPILFALDVSNSMKANDYPPDRIDWSLQLLSFLTDSLRGNQLGLLLYSDFAHTSIPFTTDINLFQKLLQTIHSQNIQGYSSNLRSCFAEAVKNFHSVMNQEGKVLVLLSDGEHYGDDFQNRLKALENLNVHLIWIRFPSTLKTTPLDTIAYRSITILKPQKDYKEFAKTVQKKLSLVPIPASLEKFAYQLDLSPLLGMLIFGILLSFFFLKSRRKDEV